MNTDPIADFLTRIRNANSAGLRTVVIPSSKIKKEITKILFDQGFILNYQFINDNVQGSIKIALKYNPISKEPVIKKIERVSSRDQWVGFKVAGIRSTKFDEGFHYVALNKFNEFI